MGSETSYQDAGKKHADTITYNDQDVLSTKFGGKIPQTITNIRIWYSKYIVGMEVFYDGVSAGTWMGSDVAGASYVDF